MLVGRLVQANLNKAKQFDNDKAEFSSSVVIDYFYRHDKSFVVIIFFHFIKRIKIKVA